MTLELLITTMNAVDFSLIDKMNIHTDAVIANQCSDNHFISRIKEGHVIRMVSTNTKGTSINRNFAMMYAKGDIVMFLDDDINLANNYENIVIEEFNNHPEADAIQFQMVFSEVNDKRVYKKQTVKGFRKETIRTALSSGVCGLAIKRSTLLKNNMKFMDIIGPGTSVIQGEDTIFKKELLDKKVAFYSTEKKIGEIRSVESTWFNGYSEKYFFAAGYIYGILYKRLAYLAAIRRAYYLSRSGKVDLTIREMIKYMGTGIHAFKEKGLPDEGK